MFAENDEMGLGAAQALKDAGIKPGVDVKIVTVDATKGAFEASRGDINVAVECNPLLAPQVYEARSRRSTAGISPSGYRRSRASSAGDRGSGPAGAQVLGSTVKVGQRRTASLPEHPPHATM